MKIIKESGRNTGAGAFSSAKVFDGRGEELCPQTETSKSGNHWEDSFSLEESSTYLVVVEDFSNSGKDNSYTRVEGSGELSPEQIKRREAFHEQHKQHK